MPHDGAIIFPDIVGKLDVLAVDTRSRRGRYHDATALTPTLTSARKDPYAILFRVPKTNDNVLTHRARRSPAMANAAVHRWAITNSCDFSIGIPDIRDILPLITNLLPNHHVFASDLFVIRVLEAKRANLASRIGSQRFNVDYSDLSVT